MPTTRVGNLDLFYQEDDFSDPWMPHDTVFIQHGYCRNSNFFRAWVPWLARDYRVVRQDFRGCGQSGDPGPDYKYSVDDLLGDFLGLLDALRIERVHYIGESLGSMFGAAAAAFHPERFKSLTIISTSIKIGSNTPKVFALGHSSWQEALLTLGTKQWFYKSRAAVGELTGDPAADDYFSSEAGRTPAHVAVALSRFAPTVDLVSLMPKITVPTLLLTPGKSAHTSPEEHSEITKLIPNCRQIVYEGANHSMYSLIPDALAKDALAFIRGVK